MHLVATTIPIAIYYNFIDITKIDTTKNLFLISKYVSVNTKLKKTSVAHGI